MMSVDTVQFLCFMFVQMFMFHVCLLTRIIATSFDQNKKSWERRQWSC